MKQEDKDLLLKDLCSRLPYGVWIERKLKSCKFAAKCMLNAFDIYSIERGQYDFYKPYLFPLSSMTEEQKEELVSKRLGYYQVFEGVGRRFFFERGCEVYDWLNANHFDFRNLIGRGLAIDCTNLNIY